MEREPTRRDALVVFLIALAPRLAAFLRARTMGLAGDESYYWDTAAQPLGAYQFRPPLWPMLLHPIHALTNDPAGGRLLAVFLGALTVALVFLLARRLFGRRMGWVSALLLAFYPNYIVWFQLLWAEGLFSLLVVAACLAFFPVERSEPPRLVRAAPILGLAFLAKEFAVIFFAAMALSNLVFVERRRVAALLPAALLFVLPMAVYLGAGYAATKTLPYDFAAVRFNASIAERGTRDGRPATAPRPPARCPERLRCAVDNLSGGLARLWGARSFALWRMHGLKLPALPYLILLAVFVHGAFVALGVFGLMTEDWTAFSVFAWTSVLLLSAAALPGFMVSRYRMPFMFLFAIETARVLTMDGSVEPKLKSPVRCALTAAAVMMVVALVVLTFPDVSQWG